MILKDFLPDPVFRDFIRFYRIVHFEFDKITEVFIKAYPPKPEECIYFNLKGCFNIEFQDCYKETIQLPIILFGQQTSINRRYFLGDRFLNFQIVFQPTGLFRLTGIPAFDLSNQCLDAESIFPKNIRSVYEQLQQACSYPEMLLIADRFVGTLVSNVRKEPHLVDSVSKFMMKVDSNVAVDRLARECCLCTKQFKRKFNERIGVNPKTYARIIRFNKAFNTKNAHPDWEWLKIAIQCNYLDYQHLSKDYKEFAGLTPPELHLLERNSPENVLGLTKDLYPSRFKAMY
jgi:AraC-like DNA-binding protein